MEDRHGAARQEGPDRADQTLKAELAEKKVNTVHWVWNWSYSTARPLEELVSGIGMPMSEQGHSETCEGHAATIDPDAAEVVWLSSTGRSMATGSPGPPRVTTATASLTRRRPPRPRPCARSAAA